LNQRNENLKIDYELANRKLENRLRISESKTWKSITNQRNENLKIDYESRKIKFTEREIKIL